MVVCLAEQHVHLLYRHLARWALSAMGSAGSPLYIAKYVERVGKQQAAAHNAASKKAAPPKPQHETPAKQQKPQNKQTRGDDDKPKDVETRSIRVHIEDICDWPGLRFGMLQ